MIIDILIGVGYKGGVENVVNSSAAYLIEAGHKVRIVQLINLDYAWANPIVDFYALTKDRFIDPDNYVELYRRFAIEHGKPDIVLATSWPIISSIAKKVFHNDIYSIPVISWMHGSVEACAEIGLGDYTDLGYADAHLAINHNLADKLQKNTSGEVIDIINPIDSSRIVYSENRNTRKLAYVGRLAPEKNIPFLLDALRDSSEVWTLDVVGDSDENGTGVGILRDYCRELGVESRVTFHGWLDNPWEVLSDVHALILPSEREGSPLVVMEAMLCGIPVISTPTDGVLDKIIPGRNGYLFPYNDTQSFLKILKYMENGSLPQLLPSKVRNSVLYVVENDPLKDMYDKIMKFIMKWQKGKTNG